MVRSWRRSLLLIVWSLLLAGPRAGAGPDSGDFPLGQAYLARVAADGEPKAIDGFIQAGDDPWVVCEELVLLGKADAAARLSAAHLTGDSDLLEAYLRRPPDPPRPLAAAITSAQGLVETDPAKAL